VYVSTYEGDDGKHYGKLVGVKTDARRSLYSNGSCSFGLSLNYFGDSDAQETARYKRARITRVYRWAQNLTQPTELDKITVRTERLTRLGAPTLRPRRLVLNVDSEEEAVRSQELEVCFELDRPLPTEKYDAILAFNMPDGPFETVSPVPQPGMAAAPSQSPPEAETDNQQVGRPIERNLDIGLSFTSGLEKVQRDNKTVVERRNRGTLDIRLAPFKDLISTTVTKLSDSSGNGRATQARVNLFTPFYVDAKVSSGKIDENSLSLNRVVFGLQHEWRFYRSIGVNNETYYGITLRGAHASDRDFKQREAKAAIEFRPVWSFLNHRLVDNVKAVERILFPNEKPSKIIPGDTGFEIRPLVGFEIGKTYHHDRPAQAIKPRDAVRRLYVGMNIVLNPRRFLTLTASNTFYFRYESQTDRHHNYFKGGIEFPLTGPVVDFNRPAQTLFLHYENGGQPPFATPNVNTLKLGYRLQWDRWFWSLR
jgi:hypothetical protein